MSEKIVAHFIGGPLAGRDKVLENLVSEYKLPTIQKYPVRINLPNGYITIAVAVQQDITYYRGARNGNAYNFVFEPVPKLNLQASILHGQLETENYKVKL